MVALEALSLQKIPLILGHYLLLQSYAKSWPCPARGISLACQEGHESRPKVMNDADPETYPLSLSPPELSMHLQVPRCSLLSRAALRMQTSCRPQALCGTCLQRSACVSFTSADCTCYTQLCCATRSSICAICLCWFLTMWRHMSR